MPRRLAGPLFCCVTLFSFATWAPELPAQASVLSPDRRTRVTVEILQGHLTYRVDRDSRALLLPSLLGFEFQGAGPIRDSLRITDTTRNSHDEWWTQPWGEVARVHDHHNELAVSVEETRAPNRRFTSGPCLQRWHRLSLRFPGTPGPGALTRLHLDVPRPMDSARADRAGTPTGSITPWGWR